jgi:hypothetical protein
LGEVGCVFAAGFAGLTVVISGRDMPVADWTEFIILSLDEWQLGKSRIVGGHAGSVNESADFNISITLNINPNNNLALREF